MQLVSVVGMSGHDLLVQLDPEPRLGRRRANPSSQRSGVVRSSAWKPPSRRIPRGRESSACRRRAGCWQRRRSGRSTDAARSARSALSAIPAIFFASSSPPTRPRFSCKMEATPQASTRPELILRRQALASGQRLSTSRARPSPSARGCPAARALEPQRVGSARAASRAGSLRQGVSWPCVPIGRSQRSPTASRTRAT